MEQAKETLGLLSGYLPSLIGALLLLVVGWILAAFLARGARAALRHTKIADRIAGWIVGEDVQAAAIEKWAGRLVFYLILIFVLVGFFQVLGLTEVTAPLLRFLNEVFTYLPRLIGPAILIVVAWFLAKVLKMLAVRALTTAKVDERLASEADIDSDSRFSIAQTLGDAVYWLTFLLFLPAILNALHLGGMLEPVSGMVDEVLGYLPNLLAAGLILFIGWLVARIVRRVIVNVLATLGADRLSEQVGLKATLGSYTLSGLIGLVVYILILVPVIIASLNALELTAVTAPASEMLSEFLAALPKLFAAALLLIIAFIVGRVLAGFVENLLHGVGLDKIVVRMGLSTKTTDQQQAQASRLVGRLILIAIMLFATIEALHLIEFEAVANLGTTFLVFAGDILLGLVIIGLGLYLANVSANAIRTMGVAQAQLLAFAARISIIILAVAIGLGEMGLATEIIALAFGILFGAFALATALAFGLGSRETAGRLAEEWVGKIEKPARKRSRPQTDAGA
jgi:hypothetical protein